jgi:arsenate reductase-like glutaredoxin family protein
MIDLKVDPLTQNDLKDLYALTGSYEALFNKRARLIKERELTTSKLDEEDYKNLLLDHYTFIKRPILLLENTLFIGNNKQTVANAKSFLSDLS